MYMLEKDQDLLILSWVYDCKKFLYTCYCSVFGLVLRLDLINDLFELFYNLVCFF